MKAKAVAILLAIILAILAAGTGTASAQTCGTCDGGGAEPYSYCTGFPLGSLYLINYYGNYMWIQCVSAGGYTRVWIPYN